MKDQENSAGHISHSTINCVLSSVSNNDKKNNHQVQEIDRPDHPFHMWRMMDLDSEVQYSIEKSPQKT